jgi:hypothetical protein
VSGISTQCAVFQKFGGIVNGAHTDATTSQVVVAGSVLVIPHAVLALRMVAIVMSLVNGAYGPRSIDYGCTDTKCVPDEPVIPRNPPDDQPGDLAMVEAPRKSEVVNPPAIALLVSGYGKPSNAISPRSIAKIDGFADIRVPTASDHKKARTGRLDGLDRAQQIRKEDYVTVGITQGVVAGDFLCAVKIAVDKFEPRLVALDARFVAHAELGADAGSTLVIAK